MRVWMRMGICGYSSSVAILMPFGYVCGMSSPTLPTTAAVAAMMTTTHPTGSASTGSGAVATLLGPTGSVKKWGVRRKKGSVPPAQIEARGRFSNPTSTKTNNSSWSWTLRSTSNIGLDPHVLPDDL